MLLPNVSTWRVALRKSAAQVTSTGLLVQLFDSNFHLLYHFGLLIFSLIFTVEKRKSVIGRWQRIALLVDFVSSEALWACLFVCARNNVYCWLSAPRV